MSFRLISFNAWHGLNGAGLLRFGEFETPGRRQLRREGMLCELANSRFDIACLQEVNPLKPRAHEFRKKLGVQTFGQFDQAGIKVLGWGIPENLNTGLLTLVRSGYSTRDYGSVKLSGGLGLIDDYISFQYEEFRYAKVVGVRGTPFGSLLVVNLHLHHGFEYTKTSDEVLAQALSNREISKEEYRRLVETFQKASDRRVRELGRLDEFMSPFAKGYDSVVICGDLNCPPEGKAYARLIEQGFVDLHAQSEKAPRNTWDPDVCADNHTIVEGGFKYPYPTFKRPKTLQEIFRRYDRQPRRIDYVFWKSLVGEKAPKADVHLLGEELYSGIHLSDHLGLRISLS